MTITMITVREHIPIERWHVGGGAPSQCHPIKIFRLFRRRQGVDCSMWVCLCTISFIHVYMYACASVYMYVLFLYQHVCLCACVSVFIFRSSFICTSAWSLRGYFACLSKKCLLCICAAFPVCLYNCLSVILSMSSDDLCCFVYTLSLGVSESCVIRPILCPPVCLFLLVCSCFSLA